MSKQITTKPFYNSSIPSDWEVKKLGDIGKIRMCKRIFNHETSENGEIPFYKIGTFGKEPDAYISKEIYEDYRKRFSFPKKGEILISAAGTLGRTVIYDGNPAYFQDSNIVWIDNDESKITNGYLYHVYQIVRYESEGGTIQRLYNSIIRDAIFPLPPLPEQKAIAHILSLMDTAINKNNALIAKKELETKWLMQNLLTGNKRLKGFENEKWRKVRLGSIGSFSKGKGILKEQVVERGFPCIRYGEIYTTHDFIIKKFKSFIIQDVAAESQEIKSGDILFAGSGETLEEIGKAVAYVGDEKAYAGGDVIILSTSEKTNAKYLAYFLETDFVRRQKRRFGQGHSVVHIYSSDLAELEISLPPIEEQAAIARVMEVADNGIQLLKNKSEKLREQKNGLMQVLLTGKKRLKI